MIRLLIIGRDAEQWRRHLGRWENDSIEVATESLPAAGVRNFSATTPDAVGIAEPDSSPRIEPIVEAIRQRALGKIVPIVTLGTPYRGDAELEIAAAIKSSEGAEALVEALEEILEVSLEPAPDYSKTDARKDLNVSGPPGEEGRTYHSTEIPIAMDGATSGEGGPGGGDPSGGRREADGAIEHPDYVIEPLEAAPEGEAVLESGSSTGGERTIPEAAGEEAIRRKLEQVRHEDYFAVLGLAREAKGEQIRDAYRRMKTRFELERIDREIQETHEAALAEIHDALDDARAVLGDERLREAYRARIASG